MKPFVCASLMILWLMILFCNSVTSQIMAADETLFENEIRPLLVQRCIKCHGPKQSESGLRLDGFAIALKGGDSGPAFVPGKPIDSLIIKAVQHLGDLKMPPDGKLADREIAALVRWIQDGAAWPDGMMLGGDRTVRGGPITDKERAFWSFQPVTDPVGSKKSADV